ncbi:hypothetical protein [Leisingera aquimarina]|nr:hypothetical protein [Leisingera aquimarina]
MAVNRFGWPASTPHARITKLRTMEVLRNPGTISRRRPICMRPDL